MFTHEIISGVNFLGEVGELGARAYAPGVRYTAGPSGKGVHTNSVPEINGGKITAGTAAACIAEAVEKNNIIVLVFPPGELASAKERDGEETQTYKRKTETT
jgi:hypothetical protein